jgi:hypothetical protein
MGLSLVVFILTSLVALTIQSPARPGTSPVPVCEFACPPTDLALRPLIDWNDAESQLFCRFQTVPNDFFCKYFTDTGLLKQDHDQGFCPPVAIPNCTIPKRKRNALPRSPAPPSPAARSVKPEIMQTRSQLGKKKRGE